MITMAHYEWQALRQKVADRRTLSHDEATLLLAEAEAGERKFMQQATAANGYYTEAHEAKTRLWWLRELAHAIRASSHCSHHAADILTLTDEPFAELLAVETEGE